MEATAQFNIRISKRIVEEMDFISKNLKISRNDWLRVRLAEMIAHEKEDIMERAQFSYLLGDLSEKELMEVIGFKTTAEMKKEKSKVKNAAREYLIGILKDVKKK